MMKCCSFLVFFFAVQLCFGQQNGAYDTFAKRPAFEMNGSGVRVALGADDYNKGTATESYLLINIDAASPPQTIKYSEFRVQVLDTNGKAVGVVVEPADKELVLEGKQLRASFKLDRQMGQRIESVRIQWGAAEHVFLYSAKEIGDVYYF